MRKHFFQLLKAAPFLCSALMFFLYQGASHHDNGIPSELTPQQQEEVLRVTEEWEEITDRFTNAMEEYLARPEQQTQMVQQIIREAEAYEKFYERFDSYPDWSSPAVEWSDETTRSVNEAAEKLNSVVELFAAEILHRADAGKHDADLDDYIRLENCLLRIAESFQQRDYCDTEECFWCKCRTYWQMN